MRKFAIVCSLGMLLLATAARAEPVVIDREAAQQRLAAIAQEVAALQQRLQPRDEGDDDEEGHGHGRGHAWGRRGKHDRDDGARALDGETAAVLARIQGQVDFLLGQVAQARPAFAPQQPLAMPVPASRRMDAEAFRLLRAEMTQARFPPEKLQLLDVAARANLFTVSQAYDLLQTFGGDEERLAALQRLAPRLVDRERAFELYGSFRHEGARARAREILAS